MTGWKNVSPPTVQSPEPPEVTPWAWSPESHGPPESPPSAQTSVRVRPVTAPSGYRTVWFFARIVPQNVPVVEPERHTAAPTGASVLPATGSSLPLKSLTTGRGVQSPLTSTKPMSASPGKTEAFTTPCASLLKPVVVVPGVPQWPAVTKPPSTEKPIEQRAVPPSREMKYGSAPRTSKSGFGARLLTFTVTAPAGTPAFFANATGSVEASGCATMTSLLVGASTYQPVRPLAVFTFASSRVLAASRSASLRLTMTGTAPAFFTSAAASLSVTATLRVVPSEAIHAPPKLSPVAAARVALTPPAHFERFNRVVAWSASRPRSRFIAASRSGETPPSPLAFVVPLSLSGVVPASDGRVKATAAAVAATTAAATAIDLRCIWNTPSATGAVGATPCLGVRTSSEDG